MQAPHRSQSGSSSRPRANGSNALGSLMLIVIALLGTGLSPMRPAAGDVESPSAAGAVLSQE